jgi:hypothetical protein
MGPVLHWLGEPPGAAAAKTVNIKKTKMTAEDKRANILSED